MKRYLTDLNFSAALLPIRHWLLRLKAPNTVPTATGVVRWTMVALMLGIGAGCGAGKPEEDAATEADSSAHSESEPQVVRLDTAGVRLGGIQIGAAESTSTSILAVTGTITYDANRVAHIGSRTDGRVLGISVDLGANVRRGQTLVELESPEVGSIRADERRAEALVKIARENFDREKRLEQQGISSRKELLEAEADLRRAEADLQSAGDRLSVLGAGHGTGGHFDISAPFAGAVVARNVGLGQMARPADTLLTVADLSRVWIELDVFERDLTRVRRGQPVAVTTEAYQGRQFPGRIVYLGAVLDPLKRTVRARVEIPNDDRALKPGMFAEARIEVGASGPPLAVVPQDAIQDVEGAPTVFVPGVAPGEFRVRAVTVGEPLDRNRVVVKTGLTPGERLVVAGAFALRSELLKGEIGEEH
ncbi:MAG: efflux RND transporter periplasmic adaptor subunit [Gemmatimonadales bacterium]|nr:efflux RND transporter periplasmic adaptor subunit [Gemmatimonadales bacterium]